ncbi:hypothetical protein CUJ84_Chr003634 [Rhizobium leguminosarum]|uniref:Uncharacterized protein n=1 Tax=Rhizobium leguminosarum TaxID=384 RepID=A0A2K9Z6T7_RHILE|nr:hypothetical protein CUJ84_Chr003634 [Rhizobium leguminosarum]
MSAISEGQKKTRVSGPDNVGFMLPKLG